MFAVFLGTGRVIYGKYGNKINLIKIMILGAAFGPWFIGIIAELSGFGLRGGMLLGSIFPLGTLVCLIWLKRKAF